MAWAFKRQTGSPTLKAVLVALANYADEDGLCWPSQRRLSEDTELSLRAVRDALSALERAKLITREAHLRDDNSRGPDRIRLTYSDQAALSPEAADAWGEAGDAAPPAGRASPPGSRCLTPRQDVPGPPAGGAGLTTFEPPPEPPDEPSKESVGGDYAKPAREPPSTVVCKFGRAVVTDQHLREFRRACPDPEFAVEACVRASLQWASGKADPIDALWGRVAQRYEQFTLAKIQRVAAGKATAHQAQAPPKRLSDPCL